MAGLLGQVFSAGNVARRKLTDLLGNPVLSAQQIIGNLNDRARVLNEMTSAATQEGVNYGPATRQLAGLLAEAYNPVGMIAPRAEALKIAQKNAAKPISEGGLGLPPDNTAMDRAKAMGFRTKNKLYHGTPEQDIKEFVPTPHDETAILGTSLTSDPAIAEFYARGRGFTEQEGANILPVMIRGKKPQDFEKFTDYLISKNLLNDRTRQLTPEAKKYLESKGISGFDMSSLYGDEVQVVDPSRIRSIFAAFDPARRNEADILAGVLPLSLLADEEQRKKADAYFRSLLGQ